MMLRLCMALGLIASLAGVARAQQPPAKPEPAKPDAANPEPAKPDAAKPAARAGRKTIVERVAAVVNDTVVLESEVGQRAAPSMGELEKIEDQRQRQRQWQALMRQALDEMVNEELILQAAEEAKLEVT